MQLSMMTYRFEQAMVQTLAGIGARARDSDKAFQCRNIIMSNRHFVNPVIYSVVSTRTRSLLTYFFFLSGHCNR